MTHAERIGDSFRIELKVVRPREVVDHACLLTPVTRFVVAPHDALERLGKPFRPELPPVRDVVLSEQRVRKPDGERVHVLRAVAHAAEVRTVPDGESDELTGSAHPVPPRRS